MGQGVSGERQMSAAMHQQPTRHKNYRPSPWTEVAQNNLRVLWYDAAWSKEDISTTLKHSVSAVEKMAGQLKLGKRPLIRTTRSVSPFRTDERKALLIKLYPIGEKAKIILEEMNKLPGVEIPSATYIGLWASELKLRRPHGLLRPGPKSRDRVAEQLEVQERKAARMVLIERHCLSCSRKFGAATRFIRMCSDCRNAA
jgi:hypothetical protein